MARGVPTRFAGFARGLNTADNPSALAEGEARSLLNVIGDQRGRVTRRPGSMVINAATSSSGAIDLSVIAVAGDPVVLAGEGTQIRRMPVSGAGGVLAFHPTHADPWTWVGGPVVGGLGPYYGMNGSDTPQCLSAGLASSTWAAAVGTLPNGKYLCQAGNRLWVSGVAGDPYAVFWSEVGDFGNWPVENVTRFAPNDGYPITGIAAVGSYVLVFKERSIWRIYDLDTSANVKVAENAGTLAHRSIVDTDTGCFFLDPEIGVCLTTGENIRPVSDRILPSLRTITVSEASKACAAVWRGHYYLGVAIPGLNPAGGDRCLLDYNIATDSWWVHDHQVSALAVRRWDGGNQLIAAMPFNVGGGVVRLFVPGLDTDNFYQGSGLDRPDDTVVPGPGPTDPGVAFPSSWSGAIHDLELPQVRKRLRELIIEGSGTMAVTVLPDAPVADPAVEGTLTFDPASLSSEQSLYSLGVANTWGLRIDGVGLASWRLDAYTLMTTARSD